MDSYLLGSEAAVSLLMSFALVNFVLAFATRNSKWVESNVAISVNLIRFYYLLMGLTWLFLGLRYWSDNIVLVFGFITCGVVGFSIFLFASYRLLGRKIHKAMKAAYVLLIVITLLAISFNNSFVVRTHMANIILSLFCIDLIRLYWAASKRSDNRAYLLVALFSFLALISFWSRSFLLVISPDNQELSWHILNLTAPAFSVLLAVLVLTATIWETHIRMVYFATRDELTGAFNRRAFKHTFSRLEDAAKSSQSAFGLILIDIDLFKKVNDRYGHDVGDRVLKDIADLLSHQVRSADHVSRIGGEEFSILLPETNASTLRGMCERLRSEINAHTFDYGDVHIQLTLSMGAGIFQGDLGYDESFKLVDDALYQAKKERDKIVMV